MEIRDFLHAKPAELSATNSTGHMITATIVHLYDEHLTAGARLDIVSYKNVLKMNRAVKTQLKKWGKSKDGSGEVK